MSDPIKFFEEDDQPTLDAYNWGEQGLQWLGESGMCSQCWIEHGQTHEACYIGCGCHDAPSDEEDEDTLMYPCLSCGAPDSLPFTGDLCDACTCRLEQGWY